MRLENRPFPRTCGDPVLHARLGPLRVSVTGGKRGETTRLPPGDAAPTAGSGGNTERMDSSAAGGGAQASPALSRAEPRSVRPRVPAAGGRRLAVTPAWAGEAGAALAGTGSDSLRWAIVFCVGGSARSSGARTAVGSEGRRPVANPPARELRGERGQPRARRPRARRLPRAQQWVSREPDNGWPSE